MQMCGCADVKICRFDFYLSDFQTFPTFGPNQLLNHAMRNTQRIFQHILPYFGQLHKSGAF